jgi:hypothetical protein
LNMYRINLSIVGGGQRRRWRWLEVEYGLGLTALVKLLRVFTVYSNRGRYPDRVQCVTSRLELMMSWTKALQLLLLLFPWLSSLCSRKSLLSTEQISKLLPFGWLQARGLVREGPFDIEGMLWDARATSAIVSAAHVCHRRMTWAPVSDTDQVFV